MPNNNVKSDVDKINQSIQALTDRIRGSLNAVDKTYFDTKNRIEVIQNLSKVEGESKTNELADFLGRRVDDILKDIKTASYKSLLASKERIENIKGIAEDSLNGTSQGAGVYMQYAEISKKINEELVNRKKLSFKVSDFLSKNGINTISIVSALTTRNPIVGLGVKYMLERRAAAKRHENMEFETDTRDSSEYLNLLKRQKEDLLHPKDFGPRTQKGKQSRYNGTSSTSNNENDTTQQTTNKSGKTKKYTPWNEREERKEDSSIPKLNRATKRKPFFPSKGHTIEPTINTEQQSVRLPRKEKKLNKAEERELLKQARAKQAKIYDAYFENVTPRLEGASPKPLTSEGFYAASKKYSFNKRGPSNFAPLMLESPEHKNTFEAFRKRRTRSNAYNAERMESERLSSPGGSFDLVGRSRNVLENGPEVLLKHISHQLETYHTEDHVYDEQKHDLEEEARIAAEHNQEKLLESLKGKNGSLPVEHGLVPVKPGSHELSIASKHPIIANALSFSGGNILTKTTGKVLSKFTKSGSLIRKVLGFAGIAGIEPAISATGSAGAGGAGVGLGSTAKIAGMGIGRLTAPLIGLAIDAVLGTLKAGDWKTSKTSAGLGGLFGGSFESGLLNTFTNSGKYALLGVTLGAAGGPPGMIAGGLIGAALGGVLGMIGGEKIANFMEKTGIGRFVSSFFTMIGTLLIAPFKMLWKDIKVIGLGFKFLFAITKKIYGSLFAPLKKVYDSTVGPILDPLFKAISSFFGFFSNIFEWVTKLVGTDTDFDKKIDKLLHDDKLFEKVLGGFHKSLLDFAAGMLEKVPNWLPGSGTLHDLAKSFRKESAAISKTAENVAPIPAASSNSQQQSQESASPIKVIDKPSSSSFSPFTKGSGTLATINGENKGNDMSKEEVKSAIISEANKQGVNPAQVLGLAESESGFNVNAKSPTGATGVFQFTKKTAKWIGIDRDNPLENIMGGVKYWKMLLTQHHGNVSAAISAYKGVSVGGATNADVGKAMKKMSGYEGTPTMMTNNSVDEKNIFKVNDNPSSEAPNNVSLKLMKPQSGFLALEAKKQIDDAKYTKQNPTSNGGNSVVIAPSNTNVSNSTFMSPQTNPRNTESSYRDSRYKSSYNT